MPNIYNPDILPQVLPEKDTEILYIAEVRSLDNKLIRIITIFDNLECFQQDNNDWKTNCVYKLTKEPESRQFMHIMDILCVEREMYDDNMYKYRCIFWDGCSSYFSE